jgi:hypothetical protein
LARLLANEKEIEEKGSSNFENSNFLQDEVCQKLKFYKCVTTGLIPKNLLLERIEALIYEDPQKVN